MDGVNKCESEWQEGIMDDDAIFQRQLVKGRKLGRKVKCSLIHVECEILVTSAGVTSDSWLRKPEAPGKVLACGLFGL